MEYFVILNFSSLGRFRNHSLLYELFEEKGKEAIKKKGKVASEGVGKEGREEILRKE